MNNYLLHFLCYTFAMIGFLAMTFFVYRKCMCSSPSSKNKNFLSVENSLKLNATKTIYVIQAGKEKFLIAGDSANTTMLAKLEETNAPSAFDIKNLETNIAELQPMKKQVQRINRG